MDDVSCFVCSACEIFPEVDPLLGEECCQEASLSHKAFSWCCPKCFRKGKAVLNKQLLAPQ